jgi:phasin
MPDTPSFEIPPQLRELAEKNVEQARAAYGQFMDFLTQTISAWPKTPANAMTSGFGAVQQRAIAFANENAESAFTLVRELAAAKDIKDVLALQSRYAQTQLQSFAHQAQDLGKLMTDAMRDLQPKG